MTSATTSARLGKWLTQRPLFQRWLERRGPLQPPFTLAYKQIYILPTRFGVTFGVLLIGMLLGALNYNNNAALFLAFLLATAAQISTFRTWRNLAGLSIDTGAVEPVFAGQPAELPVSIQERNSIRRPIIQLGYAEQPGEQHDLPAGESVKLMIPLATSQRGWLHCPRLQLATVYPLGLFRAWAYIQPGAAGIVYPALPKNPPPLPAASAGDGKRRSLHDPEADFAGLRNYRDGDNLKDIAWKASARGNQLISRDDPPGQYSEYLFRISDVVTDDTEYALSVLCSWIVNAEHSDARYGLDLPGTLIKPDKGAAHRHRCLQTLALWKS